MNWASIVRRTAIGAVLVASVVVPSCCQTYRFRAVRLGNISDRDGLSRVVRGELNMAFERKNPAAIGVKSPYRGLVEPALVMSIDKVPSGDRWVHEIKFDSYRVQVHLRDTAVKVFTRRDNDWTNRFRKIATDAWHINAGSAIIDGEVVVPAADAAPTIGPRRPAASETLTIAGFALDGSKWDASWRCTSTWPRSRMSNY